MKTTLLILGIFLSLSFSSYAFHGGEPTAQQGVSFHEGNWKSALKKAKEENKPIFLDVYASWCGPCKLLKSKTFTDPEVAEFFNQNFINVSIDAEKGEGISIAKQFNVSAYPSLYILNPDGEAVVLTRGFQYPEEMLEIGKAGLREATK